MTEKAKQLRLLNVIINNKEAFSPYISEFAEELRVQLRADIESKQIRTFTVEELAKRANMHHFYQLAYRHFSEEVHTTVKSLESYVVSDEHGYIQTFEKGPQLFEVNEFNTAAFCLLIAWRALTIFCRWGSRPRLKASRTGSWAFPCRESKKNPHNPEQAEAAVGYYLGSPVFFDRLVGNRVHVRLHAVAKEILLADRTRLH